MRLQKLCKIHSVYSGSKSLGCVSLEHFNSLYSPNRSLECYSQYEFDTLIKYLVKNFSSSTLTAMILNINLKREL